MSRFLRCAGAFIARDVRAELSYRLAFLLQIGGLAWMLVLFWFAARMIGDDVPALQRYGGNYFSFILLGYAPLEFLRRFRAFEKGTPSHDQFGNLFAQFIGLCFHLLRLTFRSTHKCETLLHFLYLRLTLKSGAEKSQHARGFVRRIAAHAVRPCVGP